MVSNPGPFEQVAFRSLARQTSTHSLLSTSSTTICNDLVYAYMFLLEIRPFMACWPLWPHFSFTTICSDTVYATVPLLETRPLVVFRGLVCKLD